MDNRLVGQIGENAAADVMRAKGYTILKRNYRCRHGEIDIIAEKYGEMAFVEVKTRTSDTFGDPGEAVGFTKRRRMRKTAEYYLMKHRIDPDVMFKVVEILIRETDDDFLESEVRI